MDCFVSVWRSIYTVGLCINLMPIRDGSMKREREKNKVVLLYDEIGHYSAIKKLLSWNRSSLAVPIFSSSMSKCVA